jgi:pre-mRNA-processing factor SLU7
MPPPPPNPRPGGGRLGGTRNGSRPTDQKSNERNEYIPSFIAKKPFYIDDATASESDYLEHQRAQSEKNHDPLATAQWYDRGSKKGPAATKYRKGACENCGSMSHKTKDCLQRKRKLGAKWTGKDIAADEVIKDVKLGWDAKRDRWNGFEASEFQEVVEEWEALEELKKAAAGKMRGGDDEDSNAEEKDNEEGAKYDEETDMGRKQATSTRNLRLREDTAKYLINLDLDSAKYDPKTRSMVAPDPSSSSSDPNKALLGSDSDNFYSKTAGDAGDFERAQQYAWETQERGGAAGAEKIHIQANPTEAQILRKRKAEEDLARQTAHKKALTEKYGDQEAIVGVKKLPSSSGNLGAAPILQSNEEFIEYDIHGRPKPPPGLTSAQRKEKSIYPEDVFLNNHSSVWGSWWKEFQWGYACCWSTVKNSFCTGEAGREAIREAERVGKDFPPLLTTLKDEEERENGGREERNGEDGKENEAQPERKKQRIEDEYQDEESRKRAQELKKAGISEAEMEKYRREKVGRGDPMAGMLGRNIEG